MLFLHQARESCSHPLRNRVMAGSAQRVSSATILDVFLAWEAGSAKRLNWSRGGGERERRSVVLREKGEVSLLGAGYHPNIQAETLLRGNYDLGK
jgi:hypothetical protein